MNSGSSAACLLRNLDDLPNCRSCELTVDGRHRRDWRAVAARRDRINLAGLFIALVDVGNFS